MQNEMRDRLIELLQQADAICNSRRQCEGCVGFGKGADCVDYQIADHLIENGVILLPCKVGATVYTIERYCNTDPYENIKGIVKPWHCEERCYRRDCSFSEFRIEPYIVNSIESALNIGRFLGTYYFLTREEAEEKLKEKEK